jgi:hypothetical protein
MAEEARLRGMDPAALVERSTAGRSRRGPGLALNLPADLANMDPRVLNLLQQALDGSGLLAGLGEQLAGAGAGGGGGGPEGGEYEVEDVVPPEPPAAAIGQLTDMGFGAPLVRKALLLSRNNVDIALEWLLQYAEAPGADAPPTQEQLRAVWGVRRRRRAAAPVAAAGAPAAPAGAAAPDGAAAADGAAAGARAAGGPAAAAAAAAAQAARAPPAAAAAPALAPAPAAPAEAAVDEAAVTLLSDMGFTADAARRALRRFGGNVDLAVAQLLGAQSAGGGAPPAPAGGQAVGGGAAEGGGDMHMAEAGSPPRAPGGGAQPQQQQQQPAASAEDEMMDAEEGFGLAVSVGDERSRVRSRLPLAIHH